MGGGRPLCNSFSHLYHYLPLNIILCLIFWFGRRAKWYTTERRHLWPELFSLYDYCEEAWYIGGDFNITRWSHEIFPIGRVTRGMRKFNNFIEAAGLLEVPLSNGNYTWSWEGNSDHFPLLLEVGAVSWGPSSFFCNSWVLIDDCLKIIKRVLDVDQSNGWANFIISLKLCKVKEKLKTWFAAFELERKRKEDLLSELEFFDSKAEKEDLSNVDLDIRMAIKGDYLQLYLLEERNLIQKTKLNWLKLGDENTSFFHKFLSAKKFLPRGLERSCQVSYLIQ